jgi:hypothetical protein
VPRPQRGYWNQLAAGMKVKRVPSPPAKEGQPEKAAFLLSVATDTSSETKPKPSNLLLWPFPGTPRSRIEGHFDDTVEACLDGLMNQSLPISFSKDCCLPDLDCLLQREQLPSAYERQDEAVFAFALVAALALSHK